jgi:DNA processing protein
MNDNQLQHHLALTMIPHVGDIHIGLLLAHFSDAEEIFRASRKDLEAVQGIGSIRANAIRSFSDFGRADAEISYAGKNKIQILVKGNGEYPEKLEQCVDAPHVLYYQGNATMNNKKVLSIIGTRAPTAYGKERVAELISVLAAHHVLVVSGMAYGIDTLAHSEAVKQGLETIGVLGHGLHTIYPFANKSLATEMRAGGGLLTEFVQGTAPDKQKGGSLITAGIANSYNVDVLAYPGRALDPLSKGCNMLIRTHRAGLITSGEELVEYMNWVPKKGLTKPIQAELFPSLSEDEQRILSLISSAGSISIDELIGLSGFRPPMVSSLLFSLEMHGLISAIPGKLYVLVGR